MASSLTRRSFVGGAAVAGAAELLAGPLTAGAAPQPQPCAPVPPGFRTAAIAVTPDGRTVWTTDSGQTTITAHSRRTLIRGRSIDVGGAPIDIAISSSGRIALVVTAFYDRPGLAVVDLRTGDVDRIDVGPEPYAVAFARDGRSAYVAGGGRDGKLYNVVPRTGRLRRTVTLGDHPRGLAIHPDGKHALVAINGAATVAVVSLDRHKIVRRIATRPFPTRLAISRDGKRALVTHNGYGAHTVTPLDLVHWRARRPVKVGLDPSGVAFSKSGNVALVSAAGSRTVTLLDGHSARRKRTIKRAGAARAIAVAGSNAIVADGATGQLKRIRLGAGR